jgi:hypothetical protein
MAAKRKKASAKKKSARSSMKRGSARKGARKSAKRSPAKKSRRSAAPRRKAAGRQSPVARVKRVTREVVQQATVAVTAGVETLKDLGENLVDRVRTSTGPTSS